MVKIKISTTCSASTNCKHFGHAQSKGTKVKRRSGTDEKMQESMNMQSMKITKENVIMQSMKTMTASKKDGAAMPCGPLLVQIEPKASNAL